MNPLLELPPFSVPSGNAANSDVIDGFAYGPYTANTWTGTPLLASAAGAMPVVGADNLATYHTMDDASNSGVTPSPPGVATVAPYFGVAGYPVRLPRELILLAHPDVFDAFVAAHGPALVAAKINLVAAACQRPIPNGWQGSADLTLFYEKAMAPNLLHWVPSTGVDSVGVEQSNNNNIGTPGYTVVNRNVGSTDVNAFRGGERLFIAATEMQSAIFNSASYGCFYESAAGPQIENDTYVARTALMNHDKARAQQTDAYFTKIARVYHLFWLPPVNADVVTPLGQFVADFTSLCAATGNCTVVNRGQLADASTALTVGDIWTYCQSFFGI